MEKALFIFLILGAAVAGTVWLKKYRPKTLSLEATESFVTKLLAETRETFFHRQPPPPDPEAVTRFKKAFDHELERLRATRQQTRGIIEANDERASVVQASPGTRVPRRLQ